MTFKIPHRSIISGLISDENEENKMAVRKELKY